MKNIKIIITLLAIAFIAQSSYAAGVSFYHTDPSGTPIRMTDETGKVSWLIIYNPFGEQGSLAKMGHNQKRFIGKQLDSETGLLNVGVRYMKDGVGRFTSPDSVGPVDLVTSRINMDILYNPQRINAYVYGLNNPYRFVDPDGKVVEVIGSAGYKATTNAHIKSIKDNNPVLKQMFEGLEGSKNIHKIEQPLPGEYNSNKTTGNFANESNGIGTSSTTYYDPYNGTTANGKKRDPSVGLTHEMKHASDKDKGIIDRSINPKTGDKISEERAIGAENLRRSFTGDKLRPGYIY